MPDNTRIEAGPGAGIALILLGMFCISINDMLIKSLSGDYPLHQMVFVRSALGLIFSLVILQFEGGFAGLWPKRPVLHLIRALMVVFANMSYFMALAVMPLADATALFFVAPLFITLLSIPLLGERVGVRSFSALGVGFLGVVVMLQPGAIGLNADAPTWVLALPIIAALAYAMLQILTRFLRFSASASAMAIYIQVTFVAVGALFYVVAGDGRYAEGVTNESLIFILRAWTWPETGDLWRFGVLGALSAVVGYCLSQAYRLGDAATIAPFEYVALPLAVMWGWLIFGTLPGLNAGLGILLIMGAGIYVFLRERVRKGALE